ncbi:MAG: 30S ribosomal protein S4 [Acidobacteria bacterium]|nr:30S ribosomal protein S4 [Acidobacteriota bacterium]
MKYIGPKVKLSRKLGIALTPKAVKYMEKRPYGPGQHGPGKRSIIPKSEYGRQLLEKQRLRFQYNVSERQMRNYFRKALAAKGPTGEDLLQRLETRLDAVVLRAGFAKSIFAARQYVDHGHVEVNGKRVNIPSFRVKPGDVVSIKEKSRKLPPILDAMAASPAGVDYVERDWLSMSAKLTRIPAGTEIPVICEIDKIVEFYSK